MTSKTKLIVVLGPTASGKTALSLFLAELFDGEIVSADSRQVYRTMNIGTAKEPNECDDGSEYIVRGIPHYLINICDPDEAFTLGLYQEKAFAALDYIAKKGHLPMLVGGSSLYISAVVDNYIIPNLSPNHELRKQLQLLGTDALFAKLQEKDPQSAAVLDPYNRRYIIRALEIVESTGQSAHTQKQQKDEPRYDALKVGMHWEREVLYERINDRVDEMVDAGLFAEGEALIEKYGTLNPSMSSIGYDEVSGFLKKELTQSEAVEKIKQRTRQLAKRQMTWWRKDDGIHWVKSHEEAEQLVRAFLK